MKRTHWLTRQGEVSTSTSTTVLMTGLTRAETGPPGRARGAGARTRRIICSRGAISPREARTACERRAAGNRRGARCVRCPPTAHVSSVQIRILIHDVAGQLTINTWGCQYMYPYFPAGMSGASAGSARACGVLLSSPDATHTACSRGHGRARLGAEPEARTLHALRAVPAGRWASVIDEINLACTAHAAAPTRCRADEAARFLSIHETCIPR